MNIPAGIKPSTMTPSNVDNIIERVGRNYPEFAEFAKVTYHLPDYAGGWKDYLRRHAMHITAAEVSLTGMANPEIPMTDNKLWSHGMKLVASYASTVNAFPFYVVSPTLWEALEATDLGDEFEIFSFNPGLPTIDFIVPRIPGNAFCEAVYSLRFMRLTQKEVMAYTEGEESFLLEGDDIYVGAEVTYRDYDRPPTGTATLQSYDDDTLGALLDDRKDTEYLKEGSRLAFQLAHLLTERKELTTNQTTTRKAKRGKKELRTPRILGSGYSIGGYSKSSGVNTDPDYHTRLHRRRGHYRSQPHGPGRSLRRAIWVEPCWVGGKETA